MSFKTSKFEFEITTTTVKDITTNIKYEKNELIPTKIMWFSTFRNSNKPRGGLFGSGGLFVRITFKGGLNRSFTVSSIVFPLRFSCFRICYMRSYDAATILRLAWHQKHRMVKKKARFS